MDLRFHLAGINNQNFLMRDEQTGSYWQQITGLAIAGPLAGQRLKLVPADDLTFATWRLEQPAGTILNDVSTYSSEYAPKDWDLDMARVPVVLNPTQLGLHARDLMLGLHSNEAARAFPYKSVLRDKLIQDRLGSDPIIVVLANDNRSVRVFEQRIPGLSATPQFYRLHRTDSEALLLDSETGSEWDFQGCAISGKLKGTCLTRVSVIKDYWFDWFNYNPSTTVYGIAQKRQQ